jgi:hypothetical protein
MKDTWIILAVVATAVLLLPDLLPACPNCKEAYMADGQTPISSGFSTSIYFMMAMPFLVFSGFALRLWLSTRHRDADSSQA